MNRGLASKVYLYQQSFDPKGVRFLKELVFIFINSNSFKK